MSLRVTWLLPVKNGMPFLPETLASIEAQTHRDWEILAWDNGSTDGTIEELRRWIPARLPGRLVTDQPLGLGAALAQMVLHCETELCARIDADDVNVPERLERQIAFFRDHPFLAVLGSQMDVIDEHGRSRGLAGRLPLQHKDIVHSMLHGNGIAHPTVLFRRDAVLEAGNYRDVGPINVEDYDLWLRVAACHRMANLDALLLHYRVHDRSTTQIAIAQNRLIEAMDDRFCEHAPRLYGCPQDQARALRARTHPAAIQVLRRIAAHLERSQPEPVADVLCSDSFLAAGRALTAPRDVASRLALAQLDRSRLAVPRELTRLGGRALKATLAGLGGRRVAAGVRHARTLWHQKAQMRQWRRAGTSIHPSVEFIGLEVPFPAVTIGRQSVVERDVTLWLSPHQGAEPKIEIKDDVFIGRNTYIGAFKPITIGALTQIGAYCYLISANHNYATRAVPIRGQGFVGAPIVIEEDVWIGTHVVVLPGVTIGRGAVIAAGSLVNKDVPPYEVWGGIPARLLKRRPE